MPMVVCTLPGDGIDLKVVVENLSDDVERLRTQGFHFRNDIPTWPGGSQILLVDPSGIKLNYFSQRRLNEHRKLAKE